MLGRETEKESRVFKERQREQFTSSEREAGRKKR